MPEFSPPIKIGEKLGGGSFPNSGTVGERKKTVIRGKNTREGAKNLQSAAGRNSDTPEN